MWEVEEVAAAVVRGSRGSDLERSEGGVGKKFREGRVEVDGEGRGSEEEEAKSSRFRG